MTGLYEMRQTGQPVVMDVTHSTQRPGALDGQSGGNREHGPLLARAAMAVGVDGIFLETHPNPDKALCDGPISLKLGDIPQLLESLQAIWKIHQS